MDFTEVKKQVRSCIESIGENDSLMYEILDCDDYLLSKIGNWKPVPDQILDLGANVGIFSLAASLVFPGVPIVCVEPSKEAFNSLKNNLKNLTNITYLFHGIGEEGKPLGMTSTGGSLGSTYYGPKEGGDVTGILLSSLDKWIDWNKNVLVKFDCEGGEIAIKDHKPSEDCLRKAWLVIGELHWGKRWGSFKPEYWMEWIESLLSKTHNTIRLFNSQKGRDPQVGSGNIQITFVRKDVII